MTKIKVHMLKIIQVNTKVLFIKINVYDVYVVKVITVNIKIDLKLS